MRSFQYLGISKNLFNPGMNDVRRPDWTYCTVLTVLAVLYVVREWTQTNEQKNGTVDTMEHTTSGTYNQSKNNKQ
jgi:fucose permease